MSLEKSCVVQTRQFCSLLKTGFDSEPKSQSFFHTVKVIFYPDCNENHWKTFLDWTGKHWLIKELIRCSFEVVSEKQRDLRGLDWIQGSDWLWWSGYFLSSVKSHNWSGRRNSRRDSALVERLWVWFWNILSLKCFPHLLRPANTWPHFSSTMACSVCIITKYWRVHARFYCSLIGLHMKAECKGIDLCRTL